MSKNSTDLAGLRQQITQGRKEFSDFTFSGEDTDRQVIVRGVKFINCQFDKVIAAPDAAGALFEGCTLLSCNSYTVANFVFLKAEFRETNFMRCDLKHANFENAKLTCCSIQDSNYLRIRLSDSILKDVKIERCGRRAAARQL